MRRFMVLVLAATALVVIPATTAGADDDAEEITGAFAGQAALFDGVIEDEGAFVGVFGDPTVWTFSGDDDDDDDDDVTTLSNVTTSFLVTGAAEPGAGNFPFAYAQTIVFTGGTGEFDEVIGGEALIIGTIDPVTFEYDGELAGFVVEDD